MRDRFDAVAENPDTVHPFPVGRAFAQNVGYQTEWLSDLPDDAAAAFTGAACPLRFARAMPGEVALDLGVGAGMDAILLSRAVEPRGRVVGIDMAPRMLARARANFTAAAAHNADLILGLAEAMPFPDASIDLILCNGIFNLAPDKTAIAREVARILRPGGRFALCEIVIQSGEPKSIQTLNDWFR